VSEPGADRDPFDLYMKDIKPLVEAGQSIPEIDKHLDMVGREPYLKELVDGYSKSYSELDGSNLFKDILSCLNFHFWFEQQWDPIVLALAVLEGAIAKALPAVFYVPISGDKGCGKTNLLALLRWLTRGKQFENISTAALAREVGYGNTILMDECDIIYNKDQQEAQAALLRQGYKADAPAYTRWDKDKKCAEEVEVFGVKFLAFRGALDSALQSRGYIIGMTICKTNDAYQYVKRNLFPERDDLPERIAKWGEDVVKRFAPRKGKREAVFRCVRCGTPITVEQTSSELIGPFECSSDQSGCGRQASTTKFILIKKPLRECDMHDRSKVKEVMYLEGFDEEVKEIVGQLGANRSSELATIAMLVAHLAGIQHEVSKSLKTANTRTEMLAGEGESEDMEMLWDIVERLHSEQVVVGQQKRIDDGQSVRLKQSEIKNLFNLARKDVGKKRVGSSTFAKLRRSLGVKDNLLAKPGNAIFWDLPVPLSTIANRKSGGDSS